MGNVTRQQGFSEMSLLHAAVDHFTSAKVLFDKNPRCYDSAGYLCHLGIELVLKTKILFLSDEFPNEHSQTKLNTQIENQNKKNR